MKITKNTVPSLAYILKNKDGEIIDQATVSEPLKYLHGYESLLPDFEAALEGKQAGDKITLHLDPEKGYGLQNPDLIQRVEKSIFEGVQNFEVGMRFIAETDHGHLPMVIVQVEDEHIVVDGNHELAGVELFFSIEVLEVREASAEEIAHKHAH